MAPRFFRARLDNDSPTSLGGARRSIALGPDRSRFGAGLCPQHRAGKVMPGSDVRDDVGDCRRRCRAAGRPRLPIRRWRRALSQARLQPEHEELAPLATWSANFSGQDTTRRNCPAMAPKLAAFARPSAKPGWKNCSRQPSTRPCRAEPYDRRNSNGSLLTPPSRRKPSPIRSIAACWKSPGPRLCKPRSASASP